MGPSHTVCAIATAPAPGAVGILRISGPEALAICRPLAPQVPDSPLPRHAYWTPLLDRAARRVDEGLFLFFPGPRSFTGEDVVELHTHGSPVLLRMLLRELLADERAVLAEAGEFTRRAFLNGRLDLVQAEAVGGLVAAESELALRQAALQLRGALSERLGQVRSPLVSLSADLEAVLNFPDESAGADEGLSVRLESHRAAVEGLLEDARAGQLLRRVPRVTLFGPVNAGKSTLFNRMLKEKRALVDDEPGTTRDTLEARLTLRGLEVVLIDTAGLRAEPGRVEALGIERMREELRRSERAVLLIPPNANVQEIEAWKAEAGDTPVLVAQGKADTVSGARAGLAVSGLTGEGVEPLLDDLADSLISRRSHEGLWLASERHVRCLDDAARALERAQAAADVGLDVVAGEVGHACAALGQITGEDVGQQILDAVFQQFCIGK